MLAPLVLLSLLQAHANTAHHALLWYFSTEYMDAENVRPVLAWVDGGGQPRDWLFDSLILYDINLYHTNGHPTEAIIDGYLDDLFAGGQLAVLSEAVGALKSELKDPDYRLQVYLTAPWLDGHDVEAWIQALFDGWEAAGVDEHLELVGFYYGNEEDACDGSEPDRVASVADAVHARGSTLIWIPYHGACRYDEWRSFGFDRATLQPNYAFRDVDESAFADTADHIHDAGMTGHEMEFGPVHNALIPDTDAELYSARAYLSHADTQNWATHSQATWYHAAEVVRYATSPGRREIYDGIYRLISANPRESVAGRTRILASADAFVQDAEGYRDAVDGGDRLNLGSNAYPNNLRTYLMFDLPQDLGGQLVAARLFLYQKEMAYGEDLTDAQLFVVDNPTWTEASLTWNTQPGTASLARISTHRFRDEPSWPQVHSLDVTDAVQTLLDLGAPVASFMLRREVEDGALSEAQLHSREEGDETAPALELVFLPIDDTGADTGTCPDPETDTGEPCAGPDTSSCPDGKGDGGGCATGTSGAGWTGMALAALAVLRRRRV